jgi:acid phosphatase family membrane protein YuiD
MFKTTNAAVNNIKKANEKMNNAAVAVANGQPGNAVRSVNSAAGNLANANQQLNNAANQARNLGLNKMAANLKNAAKKVKEAKLVEALGHTANAVKAMNTRSP